VCEVGSGIGDVNPWARHGSMSSMSVAESTVEAAERRDDVAATPKVAGRPRPIVLVVLGVATGVVMTLVLGPWRDRGSDEGAVGRATIDVPVSAVSDDTATSVSEPAGSNIVAVVTPEVENHPELLPLSGSDRQVGGYVVGRHSLLVEGIAFSFEVPAPAWEPYCCSDLDRSAPMAPSEGLYTTTLLISKDTGGPQGAEGVLFWAGYPEATYADPCPDLLSDSAVTGDGAAAVATMVASAPGIDLVSGPAETMIGGRPAQHVQVIVRDDLGCGPGFFYAWNPQSEGPFWSLEVGDTVDVWIIDVDGEVLFIAGGTHSDRLVAEEFTQIVASIRFDCEPISHSTPQIDYVIDLDTCAMTPLTASILESLAEPESPVSPSSYAASPDGTRLAYVGIDSDGHPQIYIADLDGTGVRQVTHDPSAATSPAWSPDGTSVAYIGYESPTRDVRDVFTVDVATAEPRQLTHGANVAGSGLQFTPDGSSVIFTRVTAVWPPNVRLLALAPTSGPVLERNITPLIGPTGELDGAWAGSMSPDGSLVTFMAGNVTAQGILCGPCRHIANLDGTAEWPTPAECYRANPAGTWSPDGSQIVCSSADHRIVLVDVATGHVTHVGDGTSAIWLDDHTLLVDV
jgi:Tol biopolymer transport system component